jgi:hypothetical protein
VASVQKTCGNCQGEGKVRDPVAQAYAPQLRITCQQCAGAGQVNVWEDPPPPKALGTGAELALAKALRQERLTDFAKIVELCVCRWPHITYRNVSGHDGACPAHDHIMTTKHPHLRTR